MQEIFLGTNWLTPKEINLLLREYSMKQGKETIVYENFAEELYEVRFELARSRIMDTNIDKVPGFFLKACEKEDKDGSGQLYIKQLQHVLRVLEQVILTPFQINVLLGFSSPDSKGMVHYAKFAEAIKDLIQNMFSINALKRKAQLIQLGQFKPSNLVLPIYGDIELFKVSF